MLIFIILNIYFVDTVTVIVKIKKNIHSNVFVYTGNPNLTTNFYVFFTSL